MINPKSVFICIAVLLMPFVSSGQEKSVTVTPGKSCPEEEFKAIMARHNAVGLAVAVVDRSKILFVDSYGYKDLDAGIPWETDDLLRIASISKSFTATGVLQLVEQGKMSLDADISDILGYRVRNPKYPDKSVTVRMLLSHTSSMNDSNGYFSMDSLSDKSWGNYEPGTGYQYCNLGYNTLGAIIEKVSGERFDRYIADHILKPLGVYAHHNVHELDPDKFVKIYRYERSDSSYKVSNAYMSIDKQLEQYTLVYSTPVFSPTGGLKISVKDLAAVMMMHMNGGKSDGVRILERSSCKLMQSEIVPTNYEGEFYGMAMLRTDDFLKGFRLEGHDGLAYGAHTAMFWHPKKKFGFIVMTNGCNSTTREVFADILCESAECLYRYFIK